MANHGSPKDEISLKELIIKAKEGYFFLKSKWKTLILAIAAGAILGFTYSLTKKPVYTASLSFAIESENSGGSGGVLSLASQFGLSLGGGGGSIFEGTNLNELFKSRTMVEQTLLKPVVYKGKTISFAEMYIQIEGWRKNWQKKPKFAKLQFAPNTKRKYFSRVHDSVLGDIYAGISKKCLTVGQKDKKIDIITLEITATNEQFSKDFCEALIAGVGSFYVSTKSKKARRNMEILERQTDSIRHELNNSIAGVAVANDNTFNLNPAQNIRRVPSSKKQVDVQANTAILTELVKQTELAKIAVRKETPLIQILDRPVYPLAKDKISLLKGVVLGSFIFWFFTAFFLIFKRILKANLPNL